MKSEKKKCHHCSLFTVHCSLLFGILLFGSSTVCSQQPSQSPTASPEFQAEVNRLAGEGLRLKEALEANLEAPNHHIAAIFQRANTKDPSTAYEFRIIESDGKTAKTIFHRSEFFFSFSALKELGKLNATDINGDGLNEILVQSGSGGNCWACNPVEIYQVKDHKAVLIAAAPIQKIADLNNDGKLELVVTDVRWEFYSGLSHAAAPSATLIYGWRGGHYINVSRDYPQFYRAEVERIKTSLDEKKALISAAEGSDDFYVGLAITLAITYRHAGEIERGLKEMETYLQENVKSPEQAKRRAEIIRDFRLGDGAQKILEIKYGDPIL